MYGDREELKHQTQKLIYNFISTHPGVSFSRIRNFFELNESTLKYHLHYLERNNRISSEKEGRRRCYYSKQHINAIDERDNLYDPKYTDLNINQKRILNMIKNEPGITKTELLRRSRLNRKTLSYNVDRLIEQNRIWKVKTNNGVGYEYITKTKLQKEIYNRLLMKLLSDEIDEETFRRIKKKLESMDIEELMK